MDKYVSVDDYLMGQTTLDKLSSEIVGNINTLIPRVNELLEKFGQYRSVNSGLRTMAHHLQIYADKNAARAKQGLPPLSVPMASKHLIGAAVDLEDRDGKLKAWCMANLKALADEGLWMEAPASCPGWCHLQCQPPKSGSRVFNP